MKPSKLSNQFLNHKKKKSKSNPFNFRKAERKAL